MKVSISLPESDVEFLDRYREGEGLPSRSAAVHRAVAELRLGALGADYADAWEQWDESGEADLWDATVTDGAAG